MTDVSAPFVTLPPPTSDPNAVHRAAGSPTPEPTIPLKRKAESTGDASEFVDELSEDQHAQQDLPRQSADEYASGKITCEACGDSVAFRDPATGKLQIELWNAHKRKCSGNAASASNSDPGDDEDIDAEGSPAELSVELPTAPTASVFTEMSNAGPPAKRRRAKRTEEERIEYLRTDPYVARFEAFRVLCAACDKWIRLRPNSTYCSIPWDAHRKSCLAKKGVATAQPSTHASLSSDAYVKRIDGERVLCRACSRWILVGADSEAAVSVWNKHRESCEAPSAPTPSVPPPSKHQLALASMPVSAPSSSSAPAPSPVPDAPRSKRSVSEILAAASAHAAEQARTGANQDSRRKNAEQRAALLREDPLLAEVEPHKVYCSLCQKWVQLRQDSTYCANPWQQHRAKCIIRAEKRERKVIDFASKSIANSKVLHSSANRSPAQSSSDLDADGTSTSGSAMDIDGVARTSSSSTTPIRKVLADLDSPTGRTAFVQRSIAHLYSTTYEHTDELTLAALLAYLNCAAPPDKYEDFDTTEVLSAANTLQSRGVLELRGDVLRPLAVD